MTRGGATKLWWMNSVTKHRRRMGIEAGISYGGKDIDGYWCYPEIMYKII
jgi:hypothetical protein